MEQPARRTFPTRLLVALACVYGPFLVAPLVAQVLGCPPCLRTWLVALPVLPGTFPAIVFADSVGAARTVSPQVASTAVVGAWLLLAAWMASESRTALVCSLILSTLFATVLVIGFVR